MTTQRTPSRRTVPQNSDRICEPWGGAFWKRVITVCDNAPDGSFQRVGRDGEACPLGKGGALGFISNMAQEGATLPTKFRFQNFKSFQDESIIDLSATSITRE